MTIHQLDCQPFLAIISLLQAAVSNNAIRAPTMIEGIVVTLTGNELKKLCIERAGHHRKRAKVYADQIKSMQKNQIEPAHNTSAGDPLANLRSRLEGHNDDAAEMEFISAHLDLKEKYRLQRDDLGRLGICKGRRW